MTRPPIFIESCAGLASVSLMLQYGRYCKPPVSRCGNKHGYALALLRIMGLRPGQGADSYLLCEPDPGCRALLHAYTDPALMREAADIIRGWKDEEPRALWERLRAEGPIKDFGAREVGRVAALHNMQQAGASLRFANNRWEKHGGESGWGAASCRWRKDGTKHEADSTTVAGPATRLDSLAHASELARHLMVAASNRLINIDSTTMRNSGKGGTTFGGAEFATEAGKVSEAAREVARQVQIEGWRCSGGSIGYGGPGRVVPGHGGGYLTQEGMVERLDTRAPGLPAHIVPDAREVFPPTMPEGCVAYMDFPYLGDGTQKITGYGHDLTLEDQCELARRWDAAGAAVYVSECVDRRPDFGGNFKWSVDITSTRIGQKRSFSTELGKTEWVTCNREPAWVPAVQQALFG